MPYGTFKSSKSKDFKLNTVATGRYLCFFGDRRAYLGPLGLIHHHLKFFLKFVLEEEPKKVRINVYVRFTMCFSRISRKCVLITTNPIVLVN